MFDRLFLGRYSNTEVCIGYIKSIADANIVKKIKERLEKIDIDGIIDSNYVRQFLEEYNTSMFRQVGLNEKPDITAAKMLEGRIAVFVDGSPIIITLPYLFYEDIQQSEDYYSSTLRVRFLRFLRIFGLMVGLILPGIYVSIQSFHYTVLPQEFLMNMLNSIDGVPLTPIFEMLFIVLLFEIIHEAALRMPRHIGMAVSIVAALVLGETAVRAGLISSPVIMIVALSAISFYTVPDQVGPLSLLRIMFLIVGGTLGLFGIVILGIGVLIYMAALDSYGTPYLAPYAPVVLDDMSDGLMKEPLDEIDKRPQSIPSVNPTRLK
jgi:spore germination protein KA